MKKGNKEKLSLQSLILTLQRPGHIPTFKKSGQLEEIQRNCQENEMKVL